MVCFLVTDSHDLQADPSSQWSSQGNDVHLIDAQQSQLEASLQAVEDFRSSWSDAGTKKGSILTHLPEELSKAVEDSWLVVEVCRALDLCEASRRLTASSASQRDFP